MSLFPKKLLDELELQTLNRFKFRQIGEFNGYNTGFQRTCRTCKEVVIQPASRFLYSAGKCNSCESRYFNSGTLQEIRECYSGRFQVVGIKDGLLGFETEIHCRDFKREPSDWVYTIQELVNIELAQKAISVADVYTKLEGSYCRRLEYKRIAAEKQIKRDGRLRFIRWGEEYKDEDSVFLYKCGWCGSIEKMTQNTLFSHDFQCSKCQYGVTPKNRKECRPLNEGAKSAGYFSEKSRARLSRVLGTKSVVKPIAAKKAPVKVSIPPPPPPPPKPVPKVGRSILYVLRSKNRMWLGFVVDDEKGLKVKKLETKMPFKFTVYKEIEAGSKERASELEGSIRKALFGTDLEFEDVKGVDEWYISNAKALSIVDNTED